MTFEEEFKTLLGSRTQVENLINTMISKYESDKIGFFKVESVGFDEETEEEIPGFQLFLLGKNCKVDNYKYYVLDISLPVGGNEFPVEVTFNTMSSKKNTYVSDINGLASYLDGVFTSSEYKTITNKLETVLF